MAIFLIADEAFRYLTYTFRYLAANPGEYNPRHPSPIQILASACRSPVYTCLCHLASLLSGTSSRLILVWRIRGVASFEEWFQQYPQDLDFLFQSVGNAICTIQRREWDELQRRQYQILCIGDPDMPCEVCKEISLKVACSQLHELNVAFE